MKYCPPKFSVSMNDLSRYLGITDDMKFSRLDSKFSSSDSESMKNCTTPSVYKERIKGGKNSSKTSLGSKKVPNSPSNRASTSKFSNSIEKRSQITNNQKSEKRKKLMKNISKYSTENRRYGDSNNGSQRRKSKVLSSNTLKNSTIEGSETREPSFISNNCIVININNKQNHDLDNFMNDIKNISLNETNKIKNSKTPPKTGILPKVMPNQTRTN